jgi:hypothetical protein
MNTQSESESRVNGTGAIIPFSRPWSDREYADHYERAYLYVRRNREAGHTTRLNQLVKWVYDSDYSDTQYQRIRRFVNQEDFFRVETSGGFCQIEPTVEAFGLSLESDVSVTEKRNTEAESESDNSADKITDNRDSESTEDTAESYPKHRVKSLLNKRLRLNAEDHADYRPEINRELATYRNNIKGTWSYFGHDFRNLNLAIPNTTRFTDSYDSAKSQRQFREALDNADRDFDHGVVVTLTIDPKRFTSHSEATESIREAKKNLLQTLDYQVGEYPTQITIPDFQSRTGLLHYHIALFGISKVSESQNQVGQPTISESQIREYWSDTYDIGSQISIQPIQTGRNGDWLLHRDDKTVSLSYYLGKRIRELQDLSELDGGSMPLKYWRHSLFWTYDLRYVTCSNSLKDDTEDSESDLPETDSVWTYLGTARYDQIPSHIRDNMILLGTP